METHLTIKHLAPYLPYGLNGFCTLFEDKSDEIIGIYTYNDVLLKNTGDCCIEYFKPILRPISDLPMYFEYLFDEIEVQNVKDFLDEDFLQDKGIDSWEELVITEPNYIPYGTLQVLLEYHFDIFGLIDKGLAVSIHDVGQVVT